MTITIYDRVQETTITSGTGSVTLQGAVAGYLSFTATVGISNQTYYGIVDDVDHVWEIGIGTLVDDTTLSRTTVIASSSGSSKINFAGNQSSVFLDVPAEKRIQIDSPNIGTINITDFFGDSISVNTVDTHDVAAVNVNTANDSANTIGQTGQTTFYGDGSNLTGISPTLQDVATAGDTAYGINVTNINTSGTGENTIGTTGQTTFYGDGSNLTGLGTAAALNVGTSPNNIVQLDGSSKLPAVDGSNLTHIFPTNAPGALVNDGDGNLDWALPYRIVNTQTANYTLIVTDEMVALNNSGSITLTVPLYSDVSFENFTSIDIVQLGTGQVSIIVADGSINIFSYVGKTRLAGQYAAATLKMLSANNWLLIGNLA